MARAALVALLLTTARAVAAPEVAHGNAATGPLAARLAAPDAADVVLLYGGEHGGHQGTCGCPARPLGSLARVEGYRRAVARRDASLLLAAGGMLDATIDAHGALRPDARAANDAMIEALRMGRWAVWNVGAPDLRHFAADLFPPEAVSANLRPDLPLIEGPAAWRVVEVGGVRVGVTGVSRDPETVPGWTAEDPVVAVERLLEALRASADLVVVLAYHTPSSVEALAALPGVDVVIEAGGFDARWPPVVVGAGVWVRSDPETRRLGELRLWLRPEGIARALDRQVDLDRRIPSSRALRRHAARAAARVEAVQREVYGAP